MASDLNKVILIGRLTRDPELRHTPSGTSVTSFTLVNNRNYTVNGDKREEVSYFDCVAWGKLGEVINEYCKKGIRIAIEGRLQQQKWEDQEGKNRSKIIIVVDNFQLLSYPKAQGDESSQGFDHSDSLKHDASFHNESNPFDEDIPF